MLTVGSVPYRKEMRGRLTRLVGWSPLLLVLFEEEAADMVTFNPREPVLRTSCFKTPPDCVVDGNEHFD